MSDKTGGQAFPTQVECDEKYMDAGGYGRVRRVRKDIPGMTLRDYMAIHAPAKEVKAIAPGTVEGCAKYLGIPLGEYKGSTHWRCALAKARYEWADAMLKERGDE